MSKKKRKNTTKDRNELWMLFYTADARLALHAALEAKGCPPSDITELTDALFDIAINQQRFMDGHAISLLQIPGLNSKEKIFTMQIMEMPTRSTPGLISCFLSPLAHTEPYCQCDVCKETREKQDA